MKKKQLGKSFAQLFARIDKQRLERMEKAGKHKCVRTISGTASRVTGHNDVILKRPVVLHRFYECKICGRDM